MPYSRLEQLKTHALWGNMYQYSYFLQEGVDPLDFIILLDPT